MRGEGDDKKNEQEGKTFSYKKCNDCGAKLHMDGNICLKCGAPYWHNCMTRKWIDRVYISHDPEDEIFSTPMNRADKCMQCINVLQRGIVCKPAICFGTGRGNCDKCRRFDATVFDCCQEIQKTEGATTEENLKILNGLFKNIGKQPTAKSPAKPMEQPQYDDEIPF